MHALENVSLTPTEGGKTVIDKGPAKSRDYTLHVIDSRTGKYHPIPIVRNAIDVSAFKTPEDPDHHEDQNGQGIRVLDRVSRPQ
jgi:hypothetical protein